MILSIELRSNHAYLVEANVSKTSIQISHTHDYEFPDAWVNDTGILDSVNFAKKLTEELKVHQFKAKKAVVVLNSSAVLFRELTIPKVDPKRVPLLVRSEMMSSLNLTPNYIMDHVELEELMMEGNPHYRVLAVATLGTVLESVVKTLNLANLKPIAIDSATNSIIKFATFIGLLRKDERSIIVDVGKGYLRLFLFDDGIYTLSRTTKLSSDFELDREDIVEAVEDNINKMIQYTFTLSNKKPIKRMILTGQDDILSEIQAVVAESHDIPCEVLTYPKSITGTSDRTLVNTIGGLIRK